MIKPLFEIIHKLFNFSSNLNWFEIEWIMNNHINNLWERKSFLLNIWCIDFIKYMIWFFFYSIGILESVTSHGNLDWKENSVLNTVPTPQGPKSALLDHCLVDLYFHISEISVNVNACNVLNSPASLFLYNLFLICHSSSLILNIYSENWVWILHHHSEAVEKVLYHLYLICNNPSLIFILKAEFEFYITVLRLLKKCS